MIRIMNKIRIKEWNLGGKEIPVALCYNFVTLWEKCKAHYMCMGGTLHKGVPLSLY